MRKFLIGVSLAGLLTGGVASNSLAEEGGASSPRPATVTLQDGMQSLSAMQAMLELFFMEAGVYPPTLDDLNLAYNAKLPKGSRQVPIPRDPATGRFLTYRAEPNRKGYFLTFPDPALYGLPADFRLTPVSWGWLALRAEQRRFEAMAKESKRHIEGIATQVEMYAKDNKGVYPETMDQLFPKYITRHPQDPVTGKNYSYSQLADGYMVSSPNPQRYGLSVFQYSSSRGMLIEVLPTGK